MWSGMLVAPLAPLAPASPLAAALRSHGGDGALAEAQLAPGGGAVLVQAPAAEAPPSGGVVAAAAEASDGLWEAVARGIEDRCSSC